MLVAAGEVLTGEQQVRDQIVIIQNWVEKLKRLVPVP